MIKSIYDLEGQVFESGYLVRVAASSGHGTIRVARVDKLTVGRKIDNWVAYDLESGFVWDGGYEHPDWDDRLRSVHPRDRQGAAFMPYEITLMDIIETSRSRFLSLRDCLHGQSGTFLLVGVSQTAAYVQTNAELADYLMQALAVIGLPQAEAEMIKPFVLRKIVR